MLASAIRIRDSVSIAFSEEQPLGFPCTVMGDKTKTHSYWFEHSSARLLNNLAWTGSLG